VTDSPIDPAIRYAIDAAIASGDVKGAGRIAIAASRGGSRLDEYVASQAQQGGAPPAAPTPTLAEQWKAADSEGRLLPHSHLRSLTLDQMGDLHQTHKDLLFRSMESLKPAAA
jgi:hypothetical protein